MSRKHRVWYPGAMYHITARGNKRSVIFIHELDYINYLNYIEEVRAMYPFKIHSYCLMSNHLHLQLQTIDHSISEIMKELHSRYAIYFNKTYRVSGHVFQGRYGSKLIEDDEYFLTVSRYIHRNPLEAKMVTSLEEYPWSSYAAYVLNKHNKTICKEKTMKLFPEPFVTHYRKFVQSGSLKEEDKQCQLK
mgnify:FL=1